MTDLLQEFCDSRGLALRVDRTVGVIRGIKVLGLHSRNGREYSPQALARAVSLYEGAKVNVNHPKGHPLAPRDYQERIGVVRNDWYQDRSYWVFVRKGLIPTSEQMASFPRGIYKP